MCYTANYFDSIYSSINHDLDLEDTLLEMWCEHMLALESTPWGNQDIEAFIEWACENQYSLPVFCRGDLSDRELVGVIEELLATLGASRTLSEKPSYHGFM